MLIGKEEDLLRRAKAQSAIVPALDEVQTMPPWAPQKALRSAAELM
jgi:NADH:ubiquinone oxidoreductase subunit E